MNIDNDTTAAYNAGWADGNNAGYKQGIIDGSPSAPTPPHRYNPDCRCDLCLTHERATHETPSAPTPPPACEQLGHAWVNSGDVILVNGVCRFTVPCARCGERRQWAMDGRTGKLLSDTHPDLPSHSETPSAPTPPLDPPLDIVGKARAVQVCYRDYLDERHTDRQNALDDLTFIVDAALDVMELLTGSPIPPTTLTMEES